MQLSVEILAAILGVIGGALAIALGFSVKKLLAFEGTMSKTTTELERLKCDTMDLLKGKSEAVQGNALIQNMISTVDANMANFKETIERVLNNFDKFSEQVLGLTQKIEVHIQAEKNDNQRLYEMQKTINKLIDSHDAVIATVNKQSEKIAIIETRLNSGTK